jgi:hypothetical protein
MLVVRWAESRALMSFCDISGRRDRLDKSGQKGLANLPTEESDGVDFCGYAAARRESGLTRIQAEWPQRSGTTSPVLGVYGASGFDDRHAANLGEVATWPSLIAAEFFESWRVVAPWHWLLACWCCYGLHAAVPRPIGALRRPGSQLFPRLQGWALRLRRLSRTLPRYLAAAAHRSMPHCLQRWPRWFRPTSPPGRRGRCRWC